MRRSLLLLMIVSALYGLMIYQLKYRVAHLETELAGKQRQVIAENESIHILSAEISYVTRPDHIAKLAEKHLQLSPVKVAQIYQLADVMPGMAYSQWANAKPAPSARMAQASSKDISRAMIEDEDAATDTPDAVQSPVSYELQ